MSGRRRVQRSVRVSLVVVLVVVSALLVAAAVATSTGVAAAAIAAVGLELVATRVMYAEVLSTRRSAARSRAEQARAFGAALRSTSADHAAATARLTSRLAGKDRTISELSATIVRAEVRANEAKVLAERESLRADKAERRADDAQARLSSVLDEVLAYRVAPLDLEESDGTDAMPSVVDLLAWEERSTAATSTARPSTGDARKRA